jgi:hypothetical protein
MELIENIENFIAVVYALRYIIGGVFITGFVISAWGWWNNITV